MGANEPIHPRYGDGSLIDVLPSVLAALLDEPERNLLGVPPAACYVVCLVDALGWNLLARRRSDAPYLASLQTGGGRALTAGVPSTTATSLVGLGTGMPPGRHGVVGYTMSAGPRLLNTLRWDSAFPPQEWQPYPTLLELAVDQGVAVTSVAKRSFAGSGLTIAGLRGGGYLPADSAGQRIDRAVRACSAGSPALVYVYEGDLDWTGHREGCESAAFGHQLSAIDAQVRRLRESMPAHAVLLVTGDHGMVDVPSEGRVDLDAEPALRTDLRLVAGDARLRYLHTRAGAAEDVAARWRERLGRRALVLTRDAAIEDGWFGPVEDRVRPRIGDVVIASMDAMVVEASATFPAESRMLGWHGSLTADEMFVPLLVDAG